MNALLALIIKDLRVELRQRDFIGVNIVLGLLFGAILASGIALTSPVKSELARLEPVFIWLLFVVSCTITLEKSLERDLEGGALYALITAGLAPTTLYLSRVASLFVLVAVGHTSSSFILILLTDLPCPPILPFSAISAGVILSYVALATLLAPLTASSRLRGPLFALVALPLLFPLFFAAVELTSFILVVGSVDLSAPALSLLVALLTIYLALGVNLYSFALGLPRNRAQSLDLTRSHDYQ